MSSDLDFAPCFIASSPHKHCGARIFSGPESAPLFNALPPSSFHFTGIAMTQPSIPESIFNIHKSDYKSTDLFLGQSGGLLDSINRPYPELFAMYKKMLSLRWDENEFDYVSCNSEFKTCSRGMYDAMIYNLAYQWEADTVASKSIVPILAPFAVDRKSVV